MDSEKYFIESFYIDRGKEYPEYLLTKDGFTSIGTIQTYVQDSIQAKDHQIDKDMSLIGLRSKNVSSLISKLKEELYKRNGIVVQANDIEYLKAKNKIFKEFKVTKWEEIPIGKYNAVHSFIEIMFDFDWEGEFAMSLKLFKKYIDICKELGVNPTLEGASKFKKKHF